MNYIFDIDGTLKTHGESYSISWQLNALRNELHTVNRRLDNRRLENRS